MSCLTCAGGTRCAWPHESLAKSCRWLAALMTLPCHLYCLVVLNCLGLPSCIVQSCPGSRSAQSRRPVPCDWSTGVRVLTPRRVLFMRTLSLRHYSHRIPTCHTSPHTIHTPIHTPTLSTFPYYPHSHMSVTHSHICQHLCVERSLPQLTKAWDRILPQRHAETVCGRRHVDVYRWNGIPNFLVSISQGGVSGGGGAGLEPRVCPHRPIRSALLVAYILFMCCACIGCTLSSIIWYAIS